MKKMIAIVLAGLLTAPLLLAQGGASRSTTLAAGYDLEGAAADNDIIVAVADMVDLTSYTLAAQPDTPRPLVVTAVDADDSTTCTFTLVGTLADGTSVTSTVAVTNDDAPYTPSPNYNFATVTSFTAGTCTGEAAGDTIQVGTTSTIPVVYFSAYSRTYKDSQGYTVRDVYSWLTPPAITGVPAKAKTSGSTTAVTSNTASSGELTPLSLFDLVLFVGKTSLDREVQIERAVTTDTDADTIAVNKALDLSAGYPYKYRKHFRGPDDEDAWIPVKEFAGGSVTFLFIQTALGDNAHTFVQCELIGAGSLPIQVDTDAITAAGKIVSTVDLRTTAYDRCRAGYQFDTSDSGDGAGETEELAIHFVGTYAN